MKDIFAICKNISVMGIGLICSMVINNRVRFVTDVLDLHTTGMAQRRENQKEMWELFTQIWDVLIHKKCLKRK